MNPYDLGILEKDQPAVPLIVFALAASIPYLSVVRYDPGEFYNAIVYEILQPIEHE
jgi:hypothetical protein